MMRNLFKYFIDNPLLVNLLSFLIVLVGLFSLSGLQKEVFPKVDFDVVIINTIYPGSSAEDVEKLVTISLERNLKSIDGIKKMNAMSAEGRSIIYIEVDPDFELDEVLDDIKNGIDTVTDLPDDAEVPIVTSLNNRRRGILKVALVGVDYKTLRFVAKDLRDNLELMPEMSQVELGGYREDEIRIQVNPVRLKELDLTFSEVVSAVKNRNLNLSAGTIETSTADIMVRTISEFESIDDIKSVVVRSNNTGENIKIGDIASVIRKPVDSSVLERAMGQEAMFLTVNIKESADVIDSANKVKERTQKFIEAKGIDGLNFMISDDMSYYVKRRLGILKDNGIIGIVLVFICLCLFLNVRASLVTSLGAPIAFLTAFMFMDSIGISLNLISMFALILVLGMLVDDSIIVSEHFYQKIEGGQDPKEAALDAALETIKPVLATILTTMVAFGSLFFMGGIMGKFLWPVPAVVIICLLASLFECFLILPSHLCDFVKIDKKPKKMIWYHKLVGFYKIILKKAISYPKTIFISFFILLIASFALATKMKFELFPGEDVRIVFFQLKGTVGTPLRFTDKAMKKLEKIALSELKKEEFEQVRAIVGQHIGEHGNRTGEHYGSMILYLTSPVDRKRSTDEITKAIQNKTAFLKDEGFDVNVKSVKGGPPQGRDIELEFTGDNFSELKKVALEAKAEIDKIEGVLTTELDYEEGKKQIVVKVDEAEAKRLGLSTSAVALELRRALSGDSVTEIRESDEDISVKVVLEDKFKASLKSLSLLSIVNNVGKKIPLKKIVKFEENPGVFLIRRLNGKRIIAVDGTVNKEVLTTVKFVQLAEPIIKEVMKKYPEINYNFAGSNEDTDESMNSLKKASIISLLTIFFILVVMFSSLGQPVVIMSAIPLGLIGVIITFFIADKALGFMAAMGVVGLIGVVVNDSIVLVSFINKTREKVEDVKEAIFEASISRFRPVILTTFTTVAGLLPVAHDPNGDPFLVPMALSFAWGLLFSTGVTLIFIPCAYYLYVRFLEILGNLRKYVQGKFTKRFQES